MRISAYTLSPHAGLTKHRVSSYPPKHTLFGASMPNPTAVPLALLTSSDTGEMKGQGNLPFASLRQSLLTVLEPYSQWPHPSLPVDEWQPTSDSIASKVTATVERWGHHVEGLLQGPNAEAANYLYKDVRHNMVSNATGSLQSVVATTLLKLNKQKLSEIEARNRLRSSYKEFSHYLTEASRQYDLMVAHGIINKDLSYTHMVTGVKDIMNPQATEKGLRLKVSASPWADTMRRKGHNHILPYDLFTIALNLTENAVKYTDKGRVSVFVGPAGAGSVHRKFPKIGGFLHHQFPKLHKFFRNSPNQLEIRVEDTGRGFDFSPTEICSGGRGQNVADCAGTGYGLNRVKKLVENTYQGKLDISPRIKGHPSLGTIVTCRIPMTEASAHEVYLSGLTQKF